MSLSDAVDDVLETLQRVGLSASEFILVLLASEKHSAHLAIKDILSNGCEIIDALTKQTSSTASKWATDITKDICAREIYNLAAKGSGTHFDVTHTTVKQLEDFRVAELATIMEKSAPVTWNLLESMLSARTQSKVTIGRDHDSDIIMESSSDEEAYWEEIGEGDLEGSLISSLANNAEFERTKLQKHRAAKTLLVCDFATFQINITDIAICNQEKNHRSQHYDEKHESAFKYLAKSTWDVPTINAHTTKSYRNTGADGYICVRECYSCWDTIISNANPPTSPVTWTVTSRSICL
jgi:hypothetical protein